MKASGILAVALALAVSPPLQGAAIQVIRVVSLAESVEVGEVSLEAHPLYGEGELVSASGLGSKGVSMDLKLGTSWQVTARAPGLWIAPLVVPSATRASEIQMRAWPVAELSGIVRTASAERPPTELQLRFAPSMPSPAAPPPSTLKCPVAEGRWRCDVPAGSPLDVVLRASGFISHYFWELQVSAGKHELPSVQLIPGASITGRVAAEGGDFSPRASRVTVEATGQPADFAAMQPRVARLADEIEPDARGFFQSGALDAGMYLVRVRHPGYPNAITPVGVVSGAEIDIGSITLQRPRTLAVEVSPAVPAHDRAWSVMLHPIGPVLAEQETRREPVEIPATGIIEIDAVVPGAYAAILLDRGQRVTTERVLVDSDPTFLTLKVERTAIEGRIWLGDDPLQASLVFARPQGATRVEMNSDEDGAFAGTLPGGGTWAVDVSSDSPRIHKALPRVEIKSKQGEATVDIRLPNGRVRGIVLNEDGTPASGALAVASWSQSEERPSITSQAAQDGRFELIGLEPGPARIFAMHGEDTSDEVDVNASDDDIGPEVELRLRRSRALSGVVVTHTGTPIPGVELRLLPMSMSAGGARMPSSTVTDLEGRWTARVPPDSSSVVMIGYPPGLPLIVRHIGLAGTDSITVRTEEVSGDLRLLPESEAFPTLPAYPKFYPVLYVRGLSLLAGELWAWSGRHGELPSDRVLPTLVRNLPLGPIRLCWLPLTVVPVYATNRALEPPPGSACTVGEILPGEGPTMTVEVPALE